MSLEALLRSIVSDEVRRVLQDELPALLKRSTTSARAQDGAEVYHSVGDAAVIAGVRPETLRTWISAGKLPEHRAGRLLRIRRDELEALMARTAKHSMAEVDLETRARDILAGRIRPKGRR
jgi:excisionase family DNA binding protein